MLLLRLIELKKILLSFLGAETFVYALIFGKSVFSIVLISNSASFLSVNADTDKSFLSTLISESNIMLKSLALQKSHL